MESKKDLWNDFYNFVMIKLIPFFGRYITRWSLKFVGSILVYVGYTENQYEEIVLGLLTFIFGAIMSIISDKYKVKE